MTRKHFQALADALASRYPGATIVDGDTVRYEALEQWKQDVEAVASACASFNPAFDRSRFYEACGR